MVKSVGGRIAKANLFGESPNGFLPSYRFTSLLGGFFPGVRRLQPLSPPFPVTYLASSHQLSLCADMI